MSKEKVQEEGSFKIKKKPKKLTGKKETINKIDLSKKEEPKKEEKDAIQIGETKEVPVGERTGDSEKVDKDVRVESSENETSEQTTAAESQIQEITNEEVQEDTPVNTTEPVVETPQTNLPENVEKLVSFMKETGGNLEDYVRLNRDYSNINEEGLLREYYKHTRPHLDHEEISFLMEDSFFFDDEVEDERAIKKKQLARKEEIAKAKIFLEDTKQKYYDEIKLRPGVTQEQQKAMDFFNRYNKEQEQVTHLGNVFREKTDNFFNKGEFKGFEFKLGEKKFRYGINDVDRVSTEQASIDNFLRKFLDKDGTISNVKDYHKALYMASNPDTVVQHFYEQGKADATKDIMAKSNNIDRDPKPNSGGDIFIDGFKVRAITGADSSKLKIQRKLKNK